MMKTRLSADAAEAAHSNAQAKSAGRDRMLHRRMRGSSASDSLENVNND
jgi:hypothetical protein